MVNIVICSFLILVLILGLFFKNFLGLLYIVSLTLLFLSTFNLCNYIIKPYEKHTRILLMDIILKLLYYFLAAFILGLEYDKKRIILIVVFYLILLLFDVYFLHIRYIYQNYSSQKKPYTKARYLISKMYLKYKFGDETALFGTEKESKYIRCLAWIAVSYISVLISTAFATFAGNLNANLGFEYIKIKLGLTIVLLSFVLAQSYFCWKALYELSVKKWLKNCICLISALGVHILFFSPMLATSSNEFLESIYPFGSALGIVIMGAILYILMLSSRYYSYCIDEG